MNRRERHRQAKEARETGQGDKAVNHGIRGEQLAGEGKIDAAIEAFRRAISIDPQYAAAHHNLGILLRRQGQFDEAIESYTRATAIQPDFVEAHYNLGNALFDLGDLDAAVASYHKALAIKPDFAQAHNNLGNALIKLGKLDESLVCYQKALAVEAEYVEAHKNLGNALQQLGQLEDAVASYHKALAINPDFAEAHNNLGLALQSLERPDEAVASYHKALTVRPDFPEALNNLGTVLQDLGDLDEAVASYRKALTIKPDYAEAHHNLGLALLLDGQLKEGWDEYVWRWQAGDGKKLRHFTQALWREEPIQGKTILVWGEQGVGDEVFFASMVPDLIDAGAKVVLECDPRLVPLYRRSFPGAECIARKNPHAQVTLGGDIDFQAPSGDLGRWFRADLASFPARSGFLKADPAQTAELRARYQERFPDKHIIGLSWRSGSKSTGVGRSIPLADWLAILSHPRCAFVSLQYGDVEEELDGLRRDHGIDILLDPDVDPFRDIDGLASQIAAIDSVFSIANITLQLAGALGVPTWALLMKTPDCRWMLDRDDSPWNPGMRLFRQEARNDWAGVIERIAKALNERFKN